MTDLYHEAILEELRHPQNVGTLTDPAVTVTETNASCGDAVELSLAFDETGEKIMAVAWRGNGCAISQAALSLLSETVKGKTRQEVLALTQNDVEQLLGFEQPIAYGRIKCLLLGLTALQKAVS